MNSPAYDIHCRPWSMDHIAMAAGVPLRASADELAGIYSRSAVIPYHGYMLYVWRAIADVEWSCAVYRFDTPARSGSAPAGMISIMHRNYDDMGEAVKAAMLRAEDIQRSRFMEKGDM